MRTFLLFWILVFEKRKENQENEIFSIYCTMRKMFLDMYLFFSTSLPISPFSFLRFIFLPSRLRFQRSSRGFGYLFIERFPAYVCSELRLKTVVIQKLLKFCNLL